ncbi:MAG: site-specific integrase [Thaumarchaeota archaeon]|nr:site-specific integrase [Nitrososphaerota archaeon]
MEGESVTNFGKGNQAEATKDSYMKKLRQFLEYIQMQADEFVTLAKKKPKDAERLIMDYVEARKREGVSGSTIRNARDAIRHLFIWNDVEGINFNKINESIPHARKVGRDRAPTKEEIRLILDNADLRMKCIILILASSGVRLGAFNYLSWGDFREVAYGEYKLARMTVYRGENEEYMTFVTPECWSALQEYKTLREKAGERITGQSPVIRDVLDVDAIKRGDIESLGPARNVSSRTIGNLLGRLLWKIGLRTKKRKMHEWKQVHGFRKFFNTQVESVDGKAFADALRGEKGSYDKFSEKELLEAYAKAIPNLTIARAVEIQYEVEKKVADNDRKLGELERTHVKLLERVDSLEKETKAIKGMLRKIIEKKV